MGDGIVATIQTPFAGVGFDSNRSEIGIKSHGLSVVEEVVMPVYEYLCRDCGPFTRMRSMSEYELPSDCPKCEASAPRVMLTAPHCSTVSAQARIAHATNERSADSPLTLSSMKGSHGAGCSCCSGRSSGLLKRGKGGTKSFPTSRPWMISH